MSSDVKERGRCTSPKGDNRGNDRRKRKKIREVGSRDVEGEGRGALNSYVKKRTLINVEGTKKATYEETFEGSQKSYWELGSKTIGKRWGTQN